MVNKKLRGRRVATRIPDSMDARLKAVVKEDGRSEAEFLRALIALAAPGEGTRRLLAALSSPSKK